MHNTKEDCGLVEHIRYDLLESNMTLAILLSKCLGYSNGPAVRIRGNAPQSIKVKIEVDTKAVVGSNVQNRSILLLPIAKLCQAMILSTMR